MERNVLLLNGSNLEIFVTYPYAFIQVSEIANRFNISITRLDLIKIPMNQWYIYLQNLLKNSTFDMILITLRNTDTCDVRDYRSRTGNKQYHERTYFNRSTQSSYFPIENTKFLIETILRITHLPIVIGGYAFSMIPEKLMNYLKPDFGVIGGPDDFFKHWETILAKETLDEIGNLVYWKKDTLQKGPLVFFPPATRREYTEKIIKDWRIFISDNYSSYGPPVQSVPIEAVRGCSMKCIYCSEHLIKGSELRYRSLDVIEDEINFLGSHGLNNLSMICSEINSENNDFFMKLADRIIKINDKRNSYEKVKWDAFYLMNLNKGEIKHLRKAGFQGGANDVVSFDDKNIEALRAPLKSKDVIRHIIDVKHIIEEENQLRGYKPLSLQERIFNNKPIKGFMKSLNYFLGNTAATSETIFHTLKAADEAGFNNWFDTSHINTATRIYDYEQPNEEVRKNSWSITRNGILNSYDEMYPSYAYPPALSRHFGDTDVLEDFFKLIGDTFLSNNHLFNKKWNWFLNKNINQEIFFSWWKKIVKSRLNFETLCNIPEVLEFLTFLAKNPSIENIDLLYNPTPGRKRLMNFTAHIVMKLIFYSQEKELIPVMKLLGLPQNLNDLLALSPFKVAVQLFNRFTNKDELQATLTAHSFNTELSRFFVNYLIYLNNTPFRSEYCKFFKIGYEKTNPL